MEKLSEEARQKRNAYYRAWRRKNPDKVTAAQDRYWRKKGMREQLQADQERRESDGQQTGQA